MAGIGIGLVLIGYSSILYGYCLFRGYDITPKEMFSSQWPPNNGVDDAGKGAASAAQKLGGVGVPA
jgi:hypothetical protein